MGKIWPIIENSSTQQLAAKNILTSLNNELNPIIYGFHRQIQKLNTVNYVYEIEC